MQIGRGHAWRQVADDLAERIAAGEWAVGDRLPSLAQTARHYVVSSTTARAALAHLRAAGVIVTAQGLGSFVAAADAPAAGGELGEVRAQVADLARRVEDLERLTRQDL